MRNDVEQKHIWEICDTSFGSDTDKNGVDWLLFIDGILYQCDAKGSIKHPNCVIEASHRYKEDNRGLFVLVFRDEPYVYLVHGKSLFTLVFSGKERMKDEDGDYYVISVNDLAKLPTNAVTKMIIPAKKTFGEFFDANFKGNEIKGMTSNEVIAYVNAIVKPLCHNFICNYDVPND